MLKSPWPCLLPRLHVSTAKQFVHSFRRRLRGAPLGGSGERGDSAVDGRGGVRPVWIAGRLWRNKPLLG